MSMNVLSCLHCRRELSVHTVLDAARVSWPAKHWLMFDCPSCGKSSHVEVSCARLSIGTLSGVPGPCFMTDSSIAIHGLQFAISEHGIEIRHAGRTWFIPARK